MIEVSEEHALLTALFPWQAANWQQLLSYIKQDKLPHALLFTGLQGIGKAQLAHYFAATVMCEDSAKQSPCGHCRSCLLLKNQSHPDLHFVSPESGSQTIKIDQVRELVKLFSETAHMGNYRIAIIDPAHAMNVQAANALLKKLEEPGSRSLFLLLSHDLANVPATIRSRCQKVFCKAPDLLQAKQWLTENSPDTNSELLLSLSGMAPLQALRAANANILSMREVFIQNLTNLVMKKTTPISVSSDFIKNKIPINLILDWLIQMIAVIIRFKATNNKAVLQEHVDSCAIMIDVASKKEWLPLFQLWDGLLKKRQIVKQHASVNQEMMMESVFIGLIQS